VVHRRLIGSLLQLGLWTVGRRRRYRIRGASMRPTLSPGDQVLIDPSAYRRHAPRVGDVVLARHPYRRDVEMVKRIDGTLPDGRLLLAGDNPDESTDGRTLGAISPDLLRGQVVLRLSAAGGSTGPAA
jgi:nickel-type superoxide dismutase maturation protease